MVSGTDITLGVLDFAPSGVAVEVDDREVTWEEFALLVGAAEAELARHGVTCASRVILREPLSLDYVVYLVALIRLEAPVIPVGDARPGGYVERVRALSSAVAEVGEGGRVRRLSSRDGRDRTGVRDRSSSGADTEAYIYFTSGSTGAPKGVIGSREGLTARIAWGITEYFSPDAWRCAARADPRFIDSLTEILGALHAGHTLVIAPREASSDLDSLGRFLRARRIEQLTITPSCLPVLARDPARTLPAVRRWILSGEPLRPSWANAARRLSPGAEIINSYGSTEVNGDVAFFRIGPSDSVPSPIPLGCAAPGVLWEVINTSSGTGELVIGGSQVAIGYVDTDADDGARLSFLAAQPRTRPHAARWFRTGDLVRVDGDSLEYVARIDDVHKVRGRRVELSAVEALIEPLPGVEQVVASVSTDAGGISRLCAHVVPTRGSDITAERLRNAMDGLCPDYFIPDRLAVVAALPRTATGKVDRGALRVGGAMTIELDEQDFASDLEFAIATVIADCAIDTVPTRSTPLSALGIDSFQMVELAQALTDVLGVEVSTLDLAGWGTIEDAAVAVLGAEASDAVTCLRPVRRCSEARVLLMLPPAIGTGLRYFKLLPHLDIDHSICFVEQTRRALDVLRCGGCAGLGRFLADEIHSGYRGHTVDILGWSFGALLAPHCQQELARLGARVGRLVLVDPGRYRHVGVDCSYEWAMRRILSDCEYDDHIPTGPFTLDDAMSITRAIPGPLRLISKRTLSLWVETVSLNTSALEGALPPRPTVPTLVIRGSRTIDELEYPPWVPMSPVAVRDTFALVDIDATHFDLLGDPAVGEVGRVVSAFLRD